MKIDPQPWPFGQPIKKADLLLLAKGSNLLIIFLIFSQCPISHPQSHPTATVLYPWSPQCETFNPVCLFTILVPVCDSQAFLSFKTLNTQAGSVKPVVEYSSTRICVTVFSWLSSLEQSLTFSWHFIKS